MGKTTKTREELFELLVVIVLGVTAVLTAWSSWISAMHSSNQAQNYTTSNNLASEGNSEYNSGMQSMMQDMLLYNEINNLSIDLHFAGQRGDADTSESIQWKIDELIQNNMTESMYDAFDWAQRESEVRGETVSPFDNEEFADSYFVAANELLAESDALLRQGNEDSANGDAYGLATVLYALTLFLLGITATFKSGRYKLGLLAVSIVAFAIATIYMFTIPLPTGFTLANFFGAR